MKTERSLKLRKKWAYDELLLTIWSSPDEIIDSGYGQIPYRDWCALEKQRHASHGDAVKLVTRKDGYIALTR